MATIIWPLSAAESNHDPDPQVALEHRVREMDSMRQFVGSLLGSHAAVLTAQDWDSLWSTAQGAGSDAEAISRVVIEAYRISQQPEVATGSVPATDLAPPSVVDPGLDPLDAFVDAVATEGLSRDPGQLPPLPGEASASAHTLVEPSPTTVRPSRKSRGRHSAARPRRGARFPSGKPLAVPLLAEPSTAVQTEPSTGRTHAGRPPRLDDRRREQLMTVASWVRNIGLIILLFVAWQLWGTGITQHHEQSVLKSQFAAKVAHVVTKPAPGFTLAPASTRIADPPQGTVMAQLQIPKINLNQYVVSGTATDDLAKGPGHYLGTAMPGQAGNVAIAGHRTTHGAPFNRLAEMAVGDPIYLTTLSGQRLTYIVSAPPVAVSPSDVTVLNNFGDDRLTLTTCNPEYSARQRLIVVAAYQAPGAPKPTAISKGTGTPYKLAPTPTSGWDIKLVPLVALEFAGLVLLGLAYRKMSKVYGRDGRWLILVPVWIALLYALFETLTNFLPAAV